MKTVTQRPTCVSCLACQTSDKLRVGELSTNFEGLASQTKKTKREARSVPVPIFNSIGLLTSDSVVITGRQDPLPAHVPKCSTTTESMRSSRSEYPCFRFFSLVFADGIPFTVLCWVRFAIVWRLNPFCRFWTFLEFKRLHFDLVNVAKIPYAADRGERG